MLNTFALNVGPTYNSYLSIVFDSGNSFPNGNPFKYTDYTELGAYIDCKCYASNSISITASTPYD